MLEKAYRLSIEKAWSLLLEEKVWIVKTLSSLYKDEEHNVIGV